VAESINPYEYDDPTDPPRGYKAIDCPDCSAYLLKPSQAPKMSLGPVPGIALGAEHGRSLCTACRGRTWVWWRLSSVPPERTTDGRRDDT
jgi:hypothetical protein